MLIILYMFLCWQTHHSLFRTPKVHGCRWLLTCRWHFFWGEWHCSPTGTFHTPFVFSLVDSRSHFFFLLLLIKWWGDTTIRIIYVLLYLALYITRDTNIPRKQLQKPNYTRSINQSSTKDKLIKESFCIMSNLFLIIIWCYFSSYPKRLACLFLTNTIFFFKVKKLKLYL